MKHRCFLSIGSNLGDRKFYLDGAVDKMESSTFMDVLNVSPYYETEPVGIKEQPRFLNAVVEVETDLSPQEVLSFIKETEQEFDRVRKERWGPRTLDIDILLYDDSEIEDKDLVIPHPYLEDRAFVLVPLESIAPDLKLPSGKHVNTVVQELEEEAEKITSYADFVSIEQVSS